MVQKDWRGTRQIPEKRSIMVEVSLDLTGEGIRLEYSQFQEGGTLDP